MIRVSLHRFLVLAAVGYGALLPGYAQTRVTQPKAWAGAETPRAKDIDGVTFDMSQHEALAVIARRYPGIELFRYDVPSAGSVSYVGQHTSGSMTRTTVALEADTSGRLWRIYRLVEFPANHSPADEDIRALAVRKYGEPVERAAEDKDKFPGSLNYAVDSNGRPVALDGIACPSSTMRASGAPSFSLPSPKPGEPGFTRELMRATLRKDVSAERAYEPPYGWFAKLPLPSPGTPVLPADRCRWQLTVAPLLIPGMVMSEMLDHALLQQAREKGTKERERRGKALATQVGM